MMKHEFEKYDEYKDSGVEWIEKLPVNWNVKRLKEVLVEVVYGTSEKTKESGKYEVLGMGDIYEGKVIFPKKRFIDYVQDNLILKKGDLLYNRTNSIALVGKVGLIEEELENVTFASYLIRLRVKNNQYNKYFWYFLNSQYFINYSRANAIQTANQANLSSSKLNQFKIIDINFNLQKTIANYLDTKTAQIDQKIKLLTKKSAKYSELKQSLISETVTCGLDKTVVMKDSGIEWIGEIPEHWKLVPIRKVLENCLDKNIGNIQSEYLSLVAGVGVIPYAEKGNVGNKRPEDIEKCKVVCPGDFVLNSMNFGIGSFGISRYKGVCSSVYIVMRPRNIDSGEYLYRIFQVKPFQTYMSSFGKGIMEIRMAIKWSDLKNVYIPYPKIEEQRAIANYLDTKTTQIDRIVETINTEIEKLKELRKTLINDVVTGKIKVTTEGE